MRTLRTSSMRTHTLVGLAGVALAQGIGIVGLSAQAPLRTQPDTMAPVPVLERIVVTATRTGRTIGELPTAVTVIPRREIEASPARTVSDLLRTLPGVTTRDYQSSIATHPTRQAPSLRGLGGGTSAGRTLVLMDGIPIADPFGGWVHWSRIPKELVDQVEIVRGGGSGIWGSRAMGGVVNILTDPLLDTGGRASLEGGGQATVRGSGSGTYRGERLAVGLAGEYLDSEGFVGVADSMRTAIDEPAGVTARVAFTKLTYALTPSLELRFGGTYLDEDRAWGTALRRASLEFGQLSGGARLTTGDGGLWSLDVFGTDQTFRSTFSSEALDRSSEDPSLDQFDVPSSSRGLSLQWSNRIGGRHEVTAGADVMRVDGEVNEDFLLIQGGFTRRRRVGGEQLLAGLYAQEVFTPSPAWHLTAAARLDHSRASEGFRTVRTIATGDALTDTVFAGLEQSEVNFSLGLQRDVNDVVSLRANVSRGYRAPTLNELYKPFQEPGNVVTESNAALEPESALGVEAGLDLDLGSRALGRLTLFWTRVDDPIVEATLEEAGPTSRVIPPCGFVRAGGVCRQRQNLDEMRSAGIEVEADVPLGPFWSVRGAYLWNSSEITRADAFPDLEGNRASRSPRHTFTGTLRFSHPRALRTSVTGRYVGTRFEDDLNDLPLESFFLVDVAASRTLRGTWELYGSLENVFDREYVTARPSNGLIRVGGPRLLLGGVRVVF